jgi:hypothetical protein
MGKWTIGLLGRCLRHSFGIPSIPQAFFNFKEFSNFSKSEGLILSEGSLSTASSRAWSLASSRHSWFPSHRSCGVNWFSKQSAIALALSTGWYFRPKRPWMAVGALGPSLFVRDFAIGYIAWGVYSVFASFVSHRSSAFFCIMRLIDFKTQLTAFLHLGSLVSCHNFLILFFILG